MDRTRQIEKLLGMLAHAEADTPEGRAARTLAARFQARYRISEEEVADARARRDSHARTQVVLDGWAEPWLLDIAFMVAAVSGYTAQLAVAPGSGAMQVRLVGPGAGKAEERARQVRASVAHAVDRAGREDGVRRLRVRGAAHGLFVQTLGWVFAHAANIGTASAYGMGLDSDLAGRFGDSALTVYRMAVTRQVLGPELERHQREAEERQQQQAREVQRAWEEAFRGDAPRPQDGGPDGRRDTPSTDEKSTETPPPASPPPSESEADRAVRRAAQDLVERTLRLAGQVREVIEARPAWLSEAVPVLPGALVARCA